MKHYLFTLLLIFISVTSYSQLECSNWHFGPTSKGLYFPPTGSPVVTNISYTPYGAEGCSVLSDPLTGALRFYTDGTRVVDATHTLMPGGTGLLGSSSCEGSGKIARDPGNCNRYYIFHSTSVTETPSSPKIFYYSVVDMTLPGNGTTAAPLGDIVPGMKNISFATGVSEGFEIIPETNTHNFWLLTTQNTPSSVSVYKFTPGSITFSATYPLIATLSDIRPIVYCKVNNKIAIGSMNDFNSTLLLTFNPASGAITSQSVIPGLPAGTGGVYYGYYAFAWSNDGTKLYLSKYRHGTTGGRLYQYNLTTSTVTLIYNVSTVSTSYSGRGLKMGPNGKIYFLYWNSTGSLIFVGAVTNPNGAGLSCAFNPTEVNMGSDLMSTHKFPDFLYSNNIVRNRPDTTVNVTKTCTSLSDTTVFSFYKPNDIDGDALSYQVLGTSSGSSASFTGTSSIQYISTATLPLTDTLTIAYCDNQCVTLCDTFKVILNIIPSGVAGIWASASLPGCTGSTQLLDAGPGLMNYSWSTGDTTQTISVLSPGTYSVTALGSNGCQYADTVNVFFNPPPSVSLGNDSTICGNIVLDAGAFPSVSWSNGVTTSADTITSSGTYSVTVMDLNGCTASDTVSLVVNPNPSVFVGNDTAICGSTTLNLATDVLFPSTLWSNGATTQTTTVSSDGLYSVIVTDVNGCAGSDSVTVNFYSLPVISLGNDTSVCGNIVLNAGTFSSVSWSNGVTTSADTITASGTYSVTVTNVNGCTDTDTISIIITPPPVIEIGGPYYFCDNAVISQTLSIPAMPGTIWSNGSTGSSITVTAPGTYYVSAGSPGCLSYDTAQVSLLFAPVSALPPEYSGCPRSFDAGPAAGYLWSTSDTTSSLYVQSSGLYSVTMTGSNGCSSSYSMNAVIAYSNPDYLSQLPNVFTPNGDLENDYYEIDNIFNSCTKFRSITIYNRWGQKVFESEDPGFRWDGKYKGKDLSAGVYFAVIGSGEADNAREDGISISIIR